MKPLFAYALLLIGVPVFVGMAIGTLISIPAGMLLRWMIDIADRGGPIGDINVSCPKPKSNLAPQDFLFPEIIDGFGASVAAAFLFRLFGVTAGLVVPIIMSAWITFYFLAYHQPKREWVAWLAGLFIGWITLANAILTP